MQFLDFSPTTDPTPDQQRDALQKGLGRAMSWAETGLLDGDLLLTACLHDQRYDRQCENNRGEWLWKLLSLTGKVTNFHDSVLNALRTVSEEHDAYQLCELAFHFAQGGDDVFRKELFEFVGRRQIPDSPNIGEGQLISLGGDDAFRFILQLRGRHLVNHDWEWDDAAVVDHAIEELGEKRVHEILEDSSEPEIQKFATGWRENQRPPRDGENLRTAYLEKMRATSYNDVIQAALTNEKAFPFRGWGMEAAENDLAAVRNRLWHEHDPDVIVRLLKVFSNRPLPQFNARLIDYCRHSNEDIRRWALNALEKNAHPLVREFALRELQAQTLDRSVVGLFIKNFQSGDEQLLLDHAELPEDPWPRHDMLMDLVHVLEDNEDADSRRLGQIAYFHTPCSSCRFYAARLLYDRQTAPDWLMAECCSDANEDCQLLFEP